MIQSGHIKNGYETFHFYRRMEEFILSEEELRYLQLDSYFAILSPSSLSTKYYLLSYLTTLYPFVPNSSTFPRHWRFYFMSVFSHSAAPLAIKTSARSSQSWFCLWTTREPGVWEILDLYQTYFSPYLLLSSPRINYTNTKVFCFPSSMQ